MIPILYEKLGIAGYCWLVGLLNYVEFKMARRSKSGMLSIVGMLGQVMRA